MSRRVAPSGSSQKRSGIEGIGSVMTISPGSPGAAGSPAASQTCSDTPSATAEISPS